MEHVHGRTLFGHHVIWLAKHGETEQMSQDSPKRVL